MYAGVNPSGTERNKKWSGHTWLLFFLKKDANATSPSGDA